MTYKCVILAKALEPMLTYTLGLISPEAVTTDVNVFAHDFSGLHRDHALAALLDGEADDGQQHDDARRQ